MSIIAHRRHIAFVARHEKGRRWLERLIEIVGWVSVGWGTFLVIRQAWNDPMDPGLAMPLLLVGIARTLIIGVLYIVGICVELSYLRERLLKEGGGLDDGIEGEEEDDDIGE